MASRTRQGDPVSEQVTMTIDGVAATTEAAFDVVNPATGAPEATAPDCTPQQHDPAMDSAAKAYRDWRRDEGRRRELTGQCADALSAAAADVPPTLTPEPGKQLAQAPATASPTATP